MQMTECDMEEQLSCGVEEAFCSYLEVEEIFCDAEEVFWLDLEVKWPLIIEEVIQGQLQEEGLEVIALK